MLPDPPSFLYEIFFGPGLISWVQNVFGAGWLTFFRIVTLPGISWGIVAAVGVCLVFWGRRSAYSVVGVIVLEALASTLMNQIFFLPRPDAPSIIRYEQLEIGSFPSGHVFTATAVWGWLYASRRVRWWVAGLIIFLVALARVFLGVHFVGDVVGAFLLGCGLVWLFGRIWPPVRGWLAERGAWILWTIGLASIAGAVLTVTVLEPDNPYAWNAVGVMIVGPFALALERRQDDGRHGSTRGMWIGAAGLVPLVAIWMSLPEGVTYITAVLTGVGTLWAWWTTPLLQRRFSPR